MIIFTDIDDTLMKTTRKMVSLDDCIVGAYSKQELPLSYIDPIRQKFINELINQHISIPVTARSVETLSRVDIDFSHEKIANFGATILNSDNSLNEEWHQHILQLSCLPSYQFALKNLQSLFASDFLSHHEVITRYANDIFIFFNLRNSTLSLVENRTLQLKTLDHLILHKLEHLFYMYITDRDVTIIPSFIKKEYAVQFIKNKYPHELTIGIGDHCNDLPFMNLCDFTIYPNDSLISKQYNFSGVA